MYFKNKIISRSSITIHKTNFEKQFPQQFTLPQIYPSIILHLDTSVFLANVNYSSHEHAPLATCTNLLESTIIRLRRFESFSHQLTELTVELVGVTQQFWFTFYYPQLLILKSFVITLSTFLLLMFSLVVQSRTKFKVENVECSKSSRYLT